MKTSEILECLSASAGPAKARGPVVFEVRNARLLAAEGSPFSGKYAPDARKAYVEFDICHSLPNVSKLPHVGCVSGFHPAALARCHAVLRHQQTNLHHLLRAYDPDTIPHDRIIGAVVDTWYPEEPKGGWVVPEKREEAIPIRVLAVVFKMANGAAAMLKKHVEGKEEWSVSIECSAATLDDVGIWIQDERKLVPLKEADDDLLAKVNKSKNGGLELGKDASGNPLALAYGAIDGEILFEGVAYTPDPAELAAEITRVRMSAAEFDFDFANGIRRNWPSIWHSDKGMNAVAFSLWAEMRAGRKSKAIEDFTTRRLEVAATADEEDVSLAAVVRLMKWGVVGPMGAEKMKSVVEAAKGRFKLGAGR